MIYYILTKLEKDHGNIQNYNLTAIEVITEFNRNDIDYLLCAAPNTNNFLVTPEEILYNKNPTLIKQELIDTIDYKYIIKNNDNLKAFNKNYLKNYPDWEVLKC